MRPTLVLATAAALALGALGGTPVGAEQATQGRAKPHKLFITTLGQVGTGACSTSIAAPTGVVIDTQAAGLPSYVAPANGVLTSFSHFANSKHGQIRLIVFANGATSTQKTVVAKSANVTVVVGQLNTVPIQLPIKAGQRIGLGYTSSGMACATTGGTGDVTLVKSSFDPDTNGSFVAEGVLNAPGVTFRPNISAVLESDVDGDGYGDVTQDGCPQSAHVTVTCPDTVVTKKPKHKVTSGKVKVKVRFTSTIAGSTFQCRLNGHKKWKPCSSPYKKRLGAGTHTLQIRAVTPAGVPDPKPAKARFTIRRK